MRLNGADSHVLEITDTNRAGLSGCWQLVRMFYGCLYICMVSTAVWCVLTLCRHSEKAPT